MEAKKFSWFSVFLCTGIAVPISLFVIWCVATLTTEMVLAQIGIVLITCIIAEKIRPTVTRENKQ